MSSSKSSKKVSPAAKIMPLAASYGKRSSSLLTPSSSRSSGLGTEPSSSSVTLPVAVAADASISNNPVLLTATKVTEISLVPLATSSLGTSTDRMAVPSLKFNVSVTVAPSMLRVNSTSPLKPSEAVRPKFSVVKPSSPFSMMSGALTIARVVVGSVGSEMRSGEVTLR
ncbi:hypothetical protein HALTITAN_2858 [Vreelandella titanicae BH1]|uniref:Uncharacterized protein n=1 Tax=Vreelandella titanicae BH1 TaxID=1204738 RepID=L9U7D3_9GAMM|nr:hypothetical protein HALTITAN_2858 [Halomonas titanicae BH1]